MKTLSKYIYESLSNNNIERLLKYVNDNNIDEIIDVLSKHTSSRLSKEAVEEYNDFFNRHGILNLNWGRKNGALKQFVSLFNENDHINALSAIVKNNGAVSINDLSDTGNIFNYCKIQIPDTTEIIDFSDEARTIATWVHSKSAAAGPCEMLLKFILKEGYDRSVGDVGIRYSETSKDGDEMEVKAATLGKSPSGGHPAGQKGTIQKTAAVYYYLNNKVLGIESDNTYADSCAYFQNEKGVKDFNDKINNAKLSKEDVIKGIVDALCFQYNYISAKNLNAANTLKNIDHLYKAAMDFANFNNGFTKQDLLNLVGCIQLYLYSQVENFKYFFCVLIDKADQTKSIENGFYILFRDCQSENTDLLNFNKVTEHLYFGVLDSTVSNQGRTGKIFIKK